MQYKVDKTYLHLRFFTHLKLICAFPGECACNCIHLRAETAFTCHCYYMTRLNSFSDKIFSAAVREIDQNKIIQAEYFAILLKATALSM